MLSGRFPKGGVPLATRLLDGIVQLLFALFLIPWIAVAAGMIVMGIVGIQRNENALLIGLPAGFALLLALAAFITFVGRRKPRRIDAFDYDNRRLTYWGSQIGPTQHRCLADIAFVGRNFTHRGGQLTGYDIRFCDDVQIFVSKELTDADKLYELLHQELLHRAAYRATHCDHPRSEP